MDNDKIEEKRCTDDDDDAVCMHIINFAGSTQREKSSEMSFFLPTL